MPNKFVTFKVSVTGLKEGPVPLHFKGVATDDVELKNAKLYELLVKGITVFGSTCDVCTERLKVPLPVVPPFNVKEP